MRKILNIKSAVYAVIISVYCLMSIVGCSESSELSRSMAKDFILSYSEYPIEITKIITVEGREQHRRKIDAYANELNSSGLANTKIKGDGRGLSWIEIKVDLTDEGKKYIRGEKEESYYLGTGLPVLAYSGSFGEVTGIVYKNEEKTNAVVEYTESYVPTPFALINDLERSNRKQPQKVNKKAYFMLYDDGWRVVRVE